MKVSARASLTNPFSMCLAVYLCATLTGVVSCASGASGVGSAHAVSDHPLLGSAAPPLEVGVPSGRGRVNLADYAGKVVVLDFWATWCEPCRKSFPAYQSLYEQFHGELAVVAVSVDESSSGIAAFVRATGAKFPIGWDEGQSAAQSYTPPKMPTSFVIDQNGIVRFVHAGYSEGDEAQIRNEVHSLLSK
ncbi:MAG TPA: TlpA disulfide reductase family protein [Polyangiaceae bacterium]|nr:TlpA disulfide reductase family protein [Polyangiaceae bacterium]